MVPFLPTPIHYNRQREASQLDARLSSLAFSQRVRETLYKFALIRNSWGTTNIDAGPIDLARVAELYDVHKVGVTRTGKILPTEVEVLNYFRLVDDLPVQPFPLSLEDVRLLHQHYFRDVRLQNDARAGQWKTVDNVVAGPYGILKTTPANRSKADVHALLDWVNGPGQELPVIVRSALFFHEFQRIHPFGDGNGRAGRLLTLLLLSIGGLPGVRNCPIDDAINDDREEYYANLNAADRGNLEQWVNYFASKVVDGYRRVHLLGQRLQLVPVSLDEGSQRLLERAYIHRAGEFKVVDVRGFYVNASRATISRRLKELDELGLIRGRGRGAGRVYAVASLDALEQTKESHPKESRGALVDDGGEREAKDSRGSHEAH